MTEISDIRPDSIHPEFGGLYVHAKKISNPGCLLFLAGQVGMEKDGTFGKDCKEQLDIAWTNIDEILSASGMDKDNIIDIFVFMNGAPQHDVEANKVLFADSVLEYFDENLPAMSAMVSAGLWVDDLCFELKLTAAK